MRMVKEIEKRPVISTLRNMEVGDKEVFPIEQSVTVSNTITSRLLKERKEGMSWKKSTNVMDSVVTVERIK